MGSFKADLTAKGLADYVLMTVHGQMKQRLVAAGFTKNQAKAVIAVAKADGVCAAVVKGRWQVEQLEQGLREEIWRGVCRVAGKYAAAFVPEGQRAGLHECIFRS